MLQGHQNDLPVRYRFLKSHMLHARRDHVGFNLDSIWPGSDPVLDPVLPGFPYLRRDPPELPRWSAVTPQRMILKPF